MTVQVVEDCIAFDIYPNADGDNQFHPLCIQLTY